MDKELKDFLDNKFTQIDSRFTQVDERIGRKAEEVIHRFQVITESMEDKIKQVAEGVVTLNEKFDRRFGEIESKMHQDHQDVLAAIKFS